MAYSHSQIQTFLTCPLKYKLEKIDKIKPNIPSENLHFTLGTAVHDTLESLYNQVSDFKIPDKQKILDHYMEVWNGEIQDMNQRNGKDMFDKESLEIFKDRGLIYIDYYYDKFHPFNQAIAMEMEKQVSIKLADNITFTGKIDRLDIDGTILIINDYKTNKKLPADKHSSIDDQIALYCLGIKQNYSKKIDKLIGRIIYLHLKTEYEWEITDQILQDTRQKYLGYAQEIENLKKRHEKGEKNVFQAKENSFCSSCVYNFMCPNFAHAYEGHDDDTFNLGELGETKVRDIINKYIDLKAKSKDLETDLKFYAGALMEYANENKFNKLFGDDKKISITRRNDFAFDEQKKSEIIKYFESQGILNDLLEIDIKKLKKIIKDGALSKDEIQPFIIDKQIEYLNRSSKIKDGENPEDKNGD